MGMAKVRRLKGPVTMSRSNSKTAEEKKKKNDVAMR